MIKFDFDTFTNKFISNEKIETYQEEHPELKQLFKEKQEMMGWYELDILFNKELIDDINKTASFIRNNCDVFLVLGIGGSYLGALAAIEALKPYFYNEKMKPEIYFLGTSLSSDYYHDLIEMIRDKSIMVNVISKSGTTLEPSIAFDLIMKLMKEKYSEEELKDRIVVTTDKEKGTLREEVNRVGYKSFVIPNNIGGRYSVFSPVGLLPIAVSGIDLNELYLGAREANANMDNQIKYAIIRELMYQKNKFVEAYVVYEPKLAAFTEWLKQLYGESLGKEEKGILPVSLINTRDLHSLGQFVQEGNKILFETVINVENSSNAIIIDEYHKSLNDMNNIASLSTSKAHLNGNVLNNIMTVQSLDERTLGYLFQFFMTSCAISGCLEKINTFNQPGVEEYKRIMKDLLVS